MSRTSLAVVGFLLTLGLAVAVRASAAELERQVHSAVASVILTAAAVALGAGLRLARRRAVAPKTSPHRQGETDAAAFTLLALAVGPLVAIVATTEAVRAAVTTRLELPAWLLLAVSLAPLVGALLLSAACAAHVLVATSAWYDTAGFRVLVAAVLAAVAGSVAPLGRQGQLIVAPLALFVAALVVLIRHPWAHGAPHGQSMCPQSVGRGVLVLGGVGLAIGGAIALPASGPVPDRSSLSETVHRRWDVQRRLQGADAIAACDLYGVDTQTLLVTGGDSVVDDEAPLLAARLARAANGVGRILFERPCNERLIRRLRREWRRAGAFPPAYEIRFRVGAQGHRMIAVGFDIPEWLDARPLPSEYHLEFGLHDAPGPRVEE